MNSLIGSFEQLRQRRCQRFPQGDVQGFVLGGTKAVDDTSDSVDTAEPFDRPDGFELLQQSVRRCLGQLRPTGQRRNTDTGQRVLFE